MDANPKSLDAINREHRGFVTSFSNRLASLLDAMARWLGNRTPDGLLYSREMVGRRLLQETCLQLEVPLRRAEALRAMAGQPPLSSGASVFDCAGMSVDPGTGQVRPGLRLWLGSIARFLALWTASLWLAFACVAGRREGRATLAFGVPEEGLFKTDDADFAAFARTGPIAPFNDARRLLVQTLAPSRASTEPARIRYTRHPLFECVRANRPAFWAWLQLLFEHACAGAVFLTAAIRFPLIAILWRDYATHALAHSLDQRGLIEGVILTNTNWSRQLLWMTSLPGRRFASHLVLYSQHDRQPDYADLSERLRGHPTAKLVQVEQFWAWTPGYAEAISRDGLQARVHIAGPVQWEPDRREKLPRESAWISVFDITPLKPEVNIYQFGLLGNYFSTENLIAFLDGIEIAARRAGLRLPLAVKPKRRTTAIHDPRYLERIRNSTTIESLGSESPVTEVIARSAVVIVYPFSSTAFVADWMNVPAIYFDPTGHVAAAHELGRNINFARGVGELESLLKPIADRLRNDAGRPQPVRKPL